MFWLGKLGMLDKSGDMIYVFVLVYLEHVGYINQIDQFIRFMVHFARVLFGRLGNLGKLI